MNNTNSIVFSRLLYEEDGHKMPYGNLCSIVTLLATPLPDDTKIQIVDDNVGKYLTEQGVVQSHGETNNREYQVIKGSKSTVNKIAKKLDRFVKDKGEVQVGIVDFMDTLENKI